MSVVSGSGNVMVPNLFVALVGDGAFQAAFGMKTESTRDGAIGMLEYRHIISNLGRNLIDNQLRRGLEGSGQRARTVAGAYGEECRQWYPFVYGIFGGTCSGGFRVS